MVAVFWRQAQAHEIREHLALGRFCDFQTDIRALHEMHLAVFVEAFVLNNESFLVDRIHRLQPPHEGTAVDGDQVAVALSHCAPRRELLYKTFELFARFFAQKLWRTWQGAWNGRLPRHTAAKCRALQFVECDVFRLSSDLYERSTETLVSIVSAAHFQCGRVRLEAWLQKWSVCFFALARHHLQGL